MGGTVSGSGNLVLQPFTSGLSVAVGALAPSNALDFTAAEMSNLQDGFSSITIGRADGSGAVTINSVTLNDPTTVQSPLAPGSIAVNGQVNLVTNGSLTLIAPSLNLNAGMASTGGDIALNGSVALENNVAITTGEGSGNITVNGTVDGAYQLSLDAGTGKISLNDSLGKINPLGGLAITGQNLGLNGDITTADGDITINAPLSLQRDIFVNTNTGNVTANSTVDGAYRLIINGGSVSIGGNIGGATPLTGLQIEAKEDINLSDISTTGGDVKLNAASDIATGDVTTTNPQPAPEEKPAGDIEITSQTGSITTGNLDTSAEGIGGKIAVDAAGDIATGNIASSSRTASAGDITLTSRDGSIAAGDIRAESLGTNAGDINLEAADSINAGNINLAGGDITLKAAEDIRTGTISSRSNGGEAGGIALEAGGDITTGNITSIGFTKAGDVSLTSTGGNITTGDIFASSAAGAGGNLNLNAAGNITTGTIDVSALLDAGDVTIATTAGNISTGNILANSTQGAGATLNFTTPGNIVTGNVSATGLTEPGAVNFINEGALQTGTIVTGEVLPAPAPEPEPEPEPEPAPAPAPSSSAPFVFPYTPASEEAVAEDSAAAAEEATASEAAPAAEEATASEETDATETPAAVESNAPTQPEVITTVPEFFFFRAESEPEAQPEAQEGANLPQTKPATPEAAKSPNNPAPESTPSEPQTDTIVQEQTVNNSLAMPQRAGASASENPAQTSRVLDVPRLTAANTLDAGNVTEALPQIEELRGQEYAEYSGDSEQVKVPMTAQQMRETLSTITAQTGTKPGIVYTMLLPEQLEVVLVTADGNPIRKTVPEANREEVLKAVRLLRSQITDPKLRNFPTYLPTAQKLYNWLIAPLEAELKAQGIDTLLFSMDAGLRALPIAALHDGQQFLVEKYRLSLIPSISLTDTGYRSLKDTHVLAMGASTFDDLNPLPAVPVELSTISQSLWQGKMLLNEQFTRANLLANRRDYHYEIVHLATHGEFNSQEQGKSFIQFWDEKIQLNQLRSLGLNNPQVELLVLSACRTALGDEKAELGFAGLAVQAGVKSALASLWYVSDEGTLGLMAKFYSHLDEAVIKAEALRQAQIAMIRGEVRVQDGELRGIAQRGGVPLPPSLAQSGDRNLSHPYYWAAFTLIGSPW